MILSWTINAWDEYLWWQKQDKKILNKINILIKDILRTPYHGLGKPELLKHEYSGFWSRRISREHRLVYKIDNSTLTIISCRFHYE